MKWRLGLDVGTNSIGWCALRLDKHNEPASFIDWGVRIFDDGRDEKTNESSAVERRNARGMRRRGDRRIIRRKALLRTLKIYGLLPQDEKTCKEEIEKLNPLELRFKALDNKLELYEIGRALFHLQQRRGFKSNRKEGGKKEAEDGITKEAAKKLAASMAAEKSRTLGEFLYKRNSQAKISTRFNKRMEGSKEVYDLYPTRQMVEDEFDTIWASQSKYYPSFLTEEAKKKIRHIIIDQRRLKPQPKGKCLLMPEEDRMAWAMPSAQKFRILKEVNNIRIISPDSNGFTRFLHQHERDIVTTELMKQGSVSFSSIRKKLNIPATSRINLEITRDKLQGDLTAAVMRRENNFGKQWDEFALAKQDEIISHIIDDNLEDDEVVEWLIYNHGIPPEQAKSISEARLPSEYCRYGSTVINAIIPLMEGVNGEDGLLEDKAIKTAGAQYGWHHSRLYTGELFEQLPYYGRVLEQHVVKNPKSTDEMVRQYGRVSNPTVHIVLNQIRKLVNALALRFGTMPEQIVLEIVRDLKHGAKETASINREILKNTKANEKRKEEIEKHGLASTPGYLLKMKLWEELATDPEQRKCPYTGKTINITQLLSDEVEVEHILPYSKTLDNTNANLTVSYRWANRIKGNESPFEGFKNNKHGIDYNEIWERVQGNLKAYPDKWKGKAWRFSENAMQAFEEKAQKIIIKSTLDGSTTEVDTHLEGFAARQLNDTSYIAKLARKYLSYCNGENNVHVTLGALTGLLRKSWGLNALIAEDEKVNAKNRTDHRHHAIDAFVIANTSRSMVQKISRASARIEEYRKHDTLRKMSDELDKPWDGFEWQQMKAHCDAITISYKPDHGSTANGSTTGCLHKETVYGLTDEKPESKGNLVFVIRVPLESLKNRKEIELIRDKALRADILEFVGEASDKEIKAVLLRYSEKTGVKRVRILDERTANTMIPVKNKQGVPYKWMMGGSNHRAEIYQLTDGKNAGKWQVEVISTFNANQKGFVPKWRTEHPSAKLVMTLHINDMVAYEKDGKKLICRVKKMLTSGSVYLRPHNIAKEEADKLSWAASANQLQLHKARKISVGIDGVVKDPLESEPTKEQSV